MKRGHKQLGLWTGLAATVLLGTLAGCGKKSGKGDEADDGNGTVTGTPTAGSTSAVTPADSTGAMGSVTLNFSRLGAASGLALQDEAVLDIGAGIVISDARINIGSIKIKANKDEDESERALKQALEDEKKSREAALEADKEALEQEKESIETKYEPLFEAASDEEEDALKDQMRAEQAVVEEKLATLESTKDQELDALEEERDGNLKWRGPFVYDLVGNSVSPAIPDVQLVDGSYRRIEFKIKPNRTLDGADPMLNSSVYVAGTVLVGSSPTPFAVSLRIDEEFKLMGAGALKVDPSISNALNVAFDPAVWFAAVDFSTASVDATGTIVVSDASNQELWQVVRDNLKRSTKFGEDEDGDGELKEDEAEGDGEEGVEAEAAESEDD
jgi:hypothetical protein